MTGHWVDDRSIRIRFWIYFSGLALFILILLWLLQIVFLNSFYKSMKIREVERAGEDIASQFEEDSFEETILYYSLQKGVHVQVFNEHGQLIFPNSPSDIYYQPGLERMDLQSYFTPLLRKGLKSKVFVEPTGDTQTSSIFYVNYLGQVGSEKYFLTANTTLNPVDTTIDILKNQLIIISAISITVAFILAYFLSNRLAAPLTSMAKTARELAYGNYDVEFPESEYKEINDLAKTLNYATGELTKTLELRKDLIANVSHDLKTPLTVIKSYGEMIRDISGDNRELREKHIETILQETDYVTTFVNDMLDLSKVESELEDLKVYPLSLEELTREVLERFKLVVERDHYDIRLLVTSNRLILGDRSKLRQVLYNFISNAINYSKENKTIEITVEDREDKVIFSVRDYGQGIKEEMIPHIWERYTRGRDNYERQVVGTGLGLYISRNILQLHGFTYGVESEVGKGSCFYFEAPAYEEENNVKII